MMWKVCLVLILMSLMSCGEAPPVPNDHFYRLTISSASMDKRRLTDGPIYIESFFAEGLYNDRALLFSNDEHASDLQQHHYYYWYTSPPRLLHDYLVQFMRNADVSPLIVDESGMRGNLRITGKVVEFERRQTTAGTTANVALELRLDNPDGNLPLLLRQYRASVDITGKDMAAVITGFNIAVDRIYREFLEDLGTALKAT